jgi:hypothetical protein
MLKFKLNSEDFEKLGDVEKTFYKASGEGYQLEVDGATDKSKLDEFRATNVDLLKAAEQFKGVDMEKINALMAQEAKLKDAEFIDKKDFEGLVESRTNTMRSDLQSKIDNLTNQLNEGTTTHNNLVSKYEIEGAATKAFATHKINPDAFDGVMAQIKSKFSIDNGLVVAKDGDNILAGADGNLTVSEFVASQPEIFKIQSNGGKGHGNENPAPMAQGTSSQDKIKAGLAARLA